MAIYKKNFVGVLPVKENFVFYFLIKKGEFGNVSRGGPNCL